jgi:hypothetical protein
MGRIGFGANRHIGAQCSNRLLALAEPLGNAR